mmetsp:Transcript_84/g.70  ORF Transcript_84/g.70 Transcript_84/m.70 type:complete len:112 (-) Transcript_84:18-353(-)|eukprot:CAMPEP_0204892002 /NCGR_PEP_ID=MMETSP1349-20130617/28553_1 /ASSEMBLY_ACC=CAM_ASM_000710 /TAXON_ID=215587 /ORGANISM="Aplanochytrium stocchinoi, Strain GSBS06" /LENGTH=111 /DNA_ID=CAMNT_0052057747 /DNA_START=72 /DNA_END=407 /DNA_ORIENTATION=-
MNSLPHVPKDKLNRPAEDILTIPEDNMASNKWITKILQANLTGPAKLYTTSQTGYGLDKLLSFIRKFGKIKDVDRVNFLTNICTEIPSPDDVDDLIHFIKSTNGSGHSLWL